MTATKKRWIASTISLVVCFAMLIGTTFAWFTDKVTSGKNTIIAGNLDVELTHTNAKVATPTPVEGKTDLFPIALWEPGVIAYENFTVKNVGNLALKYALTLNVNDYNATSAGHNLTEVIKAVVVPGGFNPTGDAAAKRAAAQGLTFGALESFQKNGNLAAGSAGDVFGVVLYWQPTDHDNDYNLNNNATSTDGGALFVDLGVELVATQDTVEADSFDTLYDATAPLSVSFKPMTKKLPETAALKIVVPEEAESSVKEATVPAKVANAVFDEVFKDSSATDKSLTLVLNVEEKSRTDYTFKYEIDMDAVIKEITGGVVTRSETKSVDDLELEFNDFVEVQATIASGLDEVKVQHDGNDMTQVWYGKEDIPATEQNPAGYFMYKKGTGTLRLWIKNFSPFVVTSKIPEARIIRDGKVVANYGTINDALKNVGQNNDIVQITNDVALTYTLYVNQNVPSFKATTYTIDLNGHTVSSNTSVFQVGNGPEVEVTFKDSSAEKTGKVVNTYSGTGYAIYQNQNGGKVIIESGTYSAGKAPLLIQDKVEIKGGTFNNDNGSKASVLAACIETKSYSRVSVSGGTFASAKYFIYGNKNGPDKIEISGGDFTGIAKENMFYNVKDYYAGIYTISITGGKFDFNVAEAFPNYVAK